MLTVEQCRKYLNSPNLTDKEIESIRNFLYKITARIVDAYEKDSNSS